ncbi:hypothetical protein FRC07_011054 [Ceratobasidium sp. 392]|nr:hypothetical protein FRC07_011054 [Ceratobasidium sp. 392]
MSSDITRWSRYVGAQVFYTLQQKGQTGEIGRFAPWIDRLGWISTIAQGDMTLDDMMKRLSAAFEDLIVAYLQLAFLKCMTSGAKSGYALLQQIAPTFMQVAFADPALWPRDPASNGISLAHALTSPQSELVCFVFADIFISLSFGTPPLVEYDTSHPMKQTHHSHPMEWDVGCCLEFLFSIMKINLWRARHLDGYLGENTPWKEIEDDVLACRPCEHGPDSDSSRLVRRHAVQEGWRQAALIYLYMVSIAIIILNDV